MTDNPPKMSAVEFMDGGYLLEVNRRFLHPLGLAMFVDPETNEFGVFDDRGDPEGYRYADESLSDPDVLAKVDALDRQVRKRVRPRVQSLGYYWQPIAEAWSCYVCGYHPESRSDWCAAGCGSDYQHMFRVGLWAWNENGVPY